jgi:hypothetical protein
MKALAEAVGALGLIGFGLYCLLKTEHTTLAWWMIILGILGVCCIDN